MPNVPRQAKPPRPKTSALKSNPPALGYYKDSTYFVKAQPAGRCTAGLTHTWLNAVKTAQSKGIQTRWKRHSCHQLESMLSSVPAVFHPSRAGFWFFSLFCLLKSTLLKYHLHIISCIHLKHRVSMCFDKCLHMNLTKSRRGSRFDLLQTHFEIRRDHILQFSSKAFPFNSQACDLASRKP